MYCLSSGKKAEGTRWLVMWRKSKPYPKGRGKPCWLSLPLCVIPASLIPSQGPRRHPQVRCRIFPLPLPASSQHMVCVLGELVPSLGRILLVSPHLGGMLEALHSDPTGVLAGHAPSSLQSHPPQGAWRWVGGKLSHDEHRCCACPHACGWGVPSSLRSLPPPLLTVCRESSSSALGL